MSKETPLYKKHKNLNAKMTEFADFKMPLWYKSIMEEYTAVRERLGLFDINHMGQIIITGQDKKIFTDYLITNNLNKINFGDILYTFICDNKGYILDDLLVYLLKDKIILIVNAGQSDKLIEHINNHKQNYNIQVEDISNKLGFLALQGPKSFDLCQKLFPNNIKNIKYYSFIKTDFKDSELILSRTGYTGEKGVELLFDSKLNNIIWDRILLEGAELGIMPCGLASRDILRLEMGYPLYSNELNGYSPIELGKTWCVSFDKDFIGKDILIKQKETGINKKSYAFIMSSIGIPRRGYEILKNDKVIGKVTSGGFSPPLNKGIGLCIINKEQAKIDNDIYINVRGKMYSAKTTKLPFIPSKVK